MIRIRFLVLVNGSNYANTVFLSFFIPHRLGNIIPKRTNSQSDTATQATEKAEVVETTVETTVVTETTETKVEEEYDPVIKEQVDKALITGAFDKSSQILKKTESRFFVFTKEGKIWYYKSKKDATNAKTIEITASSEIKKSESDRSHHIDIVTSSRTYKLMLRSAEELNDWHTTLTEYQKTLPKPPKLKPSLNQARKTRKPDHKKETSKVR